MPDALRGLERADGRGRQFRFGLVVAGVCAWALGCSAVADAALYGSVTAYGSSSPASVQLGETDAFAPVPAGNLAAGTSPSVAAQLGGGYDIAEHAPSGRLRVASSSGGSVVFDTQLAASTSPSIAATYASGPYVVAFQGADGDLMLAHPGSATQNLSSQMAAGTSPSAAATINSCCVIAFHGANGDLFVWTPGAGATDSGAAVATGTSPSIAAEPQGDYAVTFHGVNGDLFTWSPTRGSRDTHALMAPGASPATAALSASGTYEAAFEAPNGHLAFSAISQRSPTGYVASISGQPIAAGTQPSIGPLAGGGWVAAFAGPGGALDTRGAAGTLTHTRRILAAGTSPAESDSPPVLNALGQGMFGISTDGSTQNERPRTLSRDLTDDAATGAKWLRVDINWAQIQAQGRRSFNWRAIDKIVKRAAAHRMSVLGVLLYTPGWALAEPACGQADCAPKPADFARFARIAVRHYSRLGVNAYEVWSEENSTAQWLPTPSPRAYTTMLKDTYPAIKRSDPNATVITGGTAPSPTNGTDYSPTDFLARLYADGAKPYFDAVGAHPYCWPAYPGQRFVWSSWYQMFGAKRSMRSVMIAHGDAGKLIWGTEFGAATYGPEKTYVSPATQAKMIYDGYALWSSYRWGGPLILFEGRDQKTERQRNVVFDFLGIRERNFAKKPAYAYYRRVVSMY